MGTGEDRNCLQLYPEATVPEESGIVKRNQPERAEQSHKLREKRGDGRFGGEQVKTRRL